MIRGLGFDVSGARDSVYYVYYGILWSIMGLYWDTGKENGNHCVGFGALISELGVLPSTSAAAPGLLARGKENGDLHAGASQN